MPAARMNNDEMIQFLINVEYEAAALMRKCSAARKRLEQGGGPAPARRGTDNKARINHILAKRKRTIERQIKKASL